MTDKSGSCRRVLRSPRGAAGVALVLVSALLFPAPVSASASTASSGLLVADSAVLDYWTPERMEAAESRDQVPPRGATGLSRTLAEEAGSPGSFPPALPTETSFRSAPGTAADGIDSTRSSSPYPYTRTEIDDPTQEGYRTAGKVFFTDPSDGTDYVCSGTVVNSENKSVVFTAAHCLFFNGEWMTNWVFVPAYDDGATPFGIWAAASLRVTAGWIDLNSPRFDFGAALMRPDPDGRRIAEVVGGRGLAWNQPVEQDFDAFGYPAAPPFEGDDLILCEARTAVTDSAMPGRGADPLGIGCDMSPGSSGGGWIIDGGYLNSLVSYGYSNLPGALFGPYFGDAAQALFDEVRAVDPGEALPPPDNGVPLRLDRVADSPDPFSPDGDRRKDQTRILFRVSEGSWVGLRIYNRRGALVRTLDRDVYTTAGRWLCPWDGRGRGGRRVPPGRYRYELRARDAAGNVATASGVVTVRR